MTYEELMNNNDIDFVVFRPSVSVDNPNALYIVSKKSVTEQMLEGYSYYKVRMLEGKSSTATFIKKKLL